MNIDTLYENFYKRKENTDLINEVIKFLLEENIPKSESFDWSMIPEIPISELGWSDVSTKDGEPVSGPQRKLLEDYLNNIAPEADLTQKLASLSNFLEEGYKTIATEGGSPAEIVAKIMSYLVFYKTLTRVITNFNASSAGFSFESFLATLLGGTQITTGGGTIADFVTGDGNYISLKLYAEKSVEVGGSFADLVDDLTNAEMQNKMDYLVVLKNLAGKEMDKSGTLSFYEFGFTLDNVADIIAASAKHSKLCIILPLVPDKSDPTGYRLALPEDTESIPGRVKVTEQELDEKYREVLKDVLATAADTHEEIAAVPDLLNTVLGHDSLTIAADNSVFFLDKGIRSAIINALVDLYGDQPEVTDIFTTKIRPEGKSRSTQTIIYIAALIQHAEEQAIQLLKKDPEAARKATVARLVPALKKGNLERSVAWYNAQTDPAIQMQALRVSNGYLNNLKFGMGKKLSTRDAPPTNAKALGVIKIGAANIAPMIESVREILNEEVYSIFSSLKELTTSLNEFFATGLKDDKKAQVAIKAADNIEKKTEKSVEKFTPKK